MEVSKKVVRMEDILKPEVIINKDDDETTTGKLKIKNKNVINVKGKPKSGKFWKSEKKKFSSIIKTRGIRNSFEKKQELRGKLKHIKELSNSIKEAKKEEIIKRKLRRRENLRRQEENRKKAEVVQVITNIKKLKKLKKNQLRMVEKRDTTVIS